MIHTYCQCEGGRHGTAAASMGEKHLEGAFEEREAEEGFKDSPIS